MRNILIKNDLFFENEMFFENWIFVLILMIKFMNIFVYFMYGILYKYVCNESVVYIMIKLKYIKYIMYVLLLNGRIYRSGLD